MTRPRLKVLKHRLYRRAKPFLPKQQSEYRAQIVRINRFLAQDNAWLFWFDGGRYDWFEKLVPKYFDGKLEKVHNGGTAYSGEWAECNLGQTYPEQGLFCSMPVRDLQLSEYDGRNHFEIAPDVDTESTVNERLAALGYREQISTGHIDISPGHTNESVRKHLDAVNGGVVRYLKPHPPLTGLEELTSGGGKLKATWGALQDGTVTYSELESAYEATYREAFEAAQDLLQDLDGPVAITADHGECLGDCGQLFHGPYHARHRHLTEVPFFTLE